MNVVRLGGFGAMRQILKDDPFEMAVERALGERIRGDRAIACAMWCALANITWRDADGDTYSYSFRSAGDLIAAIYRKGNYMDWYCCGRVGDVDEEISDSMKEEGWFWEKYSETKEPK
jgi:hypothetical protein